MKNESDIEFTASPTLPQGVDFTPETNQAGDASRDQQAALDDGRLPLASPEVVLGAALLALFLGACSPTAGD